MVFSYSSAGDLGGHLVEVGDQFHRRVAVGAHERHRAVKRVERLLDRLRLCLGEFVEHDPARGEVRRHLLRIIQDGARLARFRDLEAERRIDHRRFHVAGEQIGHQAAAADRHAGEVDLPVLDGPQRQQVGARSCRRDRDLLAVEVLDVERRFCRHHQLPAEIAHRGVGDDPRHHAFLAARRYQRRRIEDDVGRARRHALERLGAAAIDRELCGDAFLFEQFLPHRGLGNGRRPIGLGRQPDPDRFGGGCGCGQQGNSGERQQGVTAGEVHCGVSSMLSFILPGASLPTSCSLRVSSKSTRWVVVISRYRLP